MGFRSGELLGREIPEDNRPANKHFRMTALLALRYARMGLGTQAVRFRPPWGAAFLISDAKRSQGPPEGALTHVKTRGALMRIASGHCCISSSNAVLSSVRRRGTDGRASRCCRCGDRPSSLARSVQRDDDSVQPPASAQLAVSSIVLQAQIHLAATLHLYSVLD